MMSETQKEPKELQLSEIEKAVGGNIFDDVACFFAGHEWENVCQINPSLTSNDIFLVHYKCTRCGKNMYQRVNTVTNERTDISAAEFNAHDKF